MKLSLKKTFSSLKYLAFLICFPLSLEGSNGTELKPSSASRFTNTFYYLYQPIAILLPHPEVRKTLYETESEYFFIRVEQDEAGNRHLVFLPSKGSQSVYNPEQPDEIVSTYAKYGMLALPALGQPPQRVLFIGMGGGIMPMYLRKHFTEIQIDIVEIDKIIPAIAKKYFGFKEDSRMSIFIEDGRVFVNKSKAKYDIIFLDVYNSEGIPFQFTTVEFFAKIKEMLKENGVLSVNLANFNRDNFIAAELNTIYEVFPNTFVFASEENTNYIPISFNSPNVGFSDFYKNTINMNKKKQFNINFEEMSSRSLSRKEIDELRNKSNIILKDDFAPVDLLK